MFLLSTWVSELVASGPANVKSELVCALIADISLRSNRRRAVTKGNSRSGRRRPLFGVRRLGAAFGGEAFNVEKGATSAQHS